MIFVRFWKSCHIISQIVALKLQLSSCLKWNWSSLGSLHILLAVESYPATTSCFATLLYSGPLCSTCQCGFSLPTRPWLRQAYLCSRLCDEQKPIKVFKWMLLFWVHTMEIFHVFNWQSVKELAQNDNKTKTGHKHKDLIWQRKHLQLTLEAHRPKWECVRMNEMRPFGKRLKQPFASGGSSGGKIKGPVRKCILESCCFALSWLNISWLTRIGVD